MTKARTLSYLEFSKLSRILEPARLGLFITILIVQPIIAFTFSAGCSGPSDPMISPLPNNSETPASSSDKSDKSSESDEPSDSSPSDDNDTSDSGEQTTHPTLPPGCEPPRIFGHRGTKSHAPENTMPAFEIAVEQNGDGLEIDVQVSSDGHLIALHDSTLSRTTDAPSGQRADETTLSEIETLDAGSWFDPEFAGTQIPTLAQVIDRFRDQSKAYFLFDLKRSSLVLPLIELIESKNIVNRSLISSSSHSALELSSKTNPDIELLYYLDDLDNLESVTAPSIRYIRIPKHQVDQDDNVDRVNDAGFRSVTGGFRVDYRYAFGLTDDIPKTLDRVANKKPEDCP